MPGDDDFSAGLGITPFARMLGTDCKISEVYSFHFLAAFQRGFDNFKNGLDDITLQALHGKQAGIEFADPYRPGEPLAGLRRDLGRFGNSL